MSEPITLTERERAVWASYASFLEGVFTNPVTREQQLSGPQIAASIEAWLDECPTEPASPPRVPVSSAHFTRVGVQSGPGQPIDICERMNRARDCVPGAELRMLLAEGEMEIRRLRGIVDECQEAAGIPADQAEDYCTVSSLIADKVVELEDRARTERRAGIEDAVEAAAALRGSREPPNWNDAINEAMRAIRALAGKPPAVRQSADFRAGIEAAAKMLEPLTSWSGPRGALATEVRALADKPPTDILLPGLEYAEAHVIAFDKPDQFIRWLRASIAARKGG